MKHVGSALVVGGALLTGAFLLYTRQTSIEATANIAFTVPGTVSVVVPAFNEADRIEQTLQDLQNQSVVQQHPELFEFIVVDNESTDATATIAAEYARVVSAPRGKLNALMTGANVASGDYLYFCDADLRLPRNFLGIVLNCFSEPNVVAASGSPYHSTSLGRFFDVAWSAVNNVAVVKMNGASLAVKKDVFFAVGGFDTSIDQFSRFEMQQEEEFGLAAKLKAYGVVVLDVDATFFAPIRHWSKTSQYHTEMLSRERF